MRRNQSPKLPSMKSTFIAVQLLRIGLGLAFSSPVLAQTPDVATQADRYLTTRMEMGNFSGAVLIAKDGKVLFRKGYGYADLDKRVSYTADTQHDVASISKMFTAMAAVKLRDQGKLKLSDSICGYLDNCPETWKPITIDQLIHHTSGIPDYEEPLELGSPAYMEFMSKPGSSARIIAEARTKPLNFKPGEKFQYSNTAYIALSYIVQRASGKPFAEYVTQALLKPAGMTHTGVIGSSPARPKNLAFGYTYGNLGWEKMLAGVSFTDGHMQRVADLPLTPPHGDGFLYSTLDDLYRWSQVMDGGSIVTASDIAEVFKPGLGDYGFGWFITRAFNRTRYNHTGALPGYVSNFIKFPEDKITIIILANIDRGRMSSISRDLSSIALGAPYDMPVRGKVVKLTQEQTATLKGEYKMADGTVLTVDESDMLTAEIKGRYMAGLIPLSPTEFYFPLGDGRAIFTIDNTGKATQVNMRYSGEDHIATRSSAN